VSVRRGRCRVSAARASYAFFEGPVFRQRPGAPCVDRPGAAGKRLEQGQPDAFTAPSVEPVVDRREGAHSGGQSRQRTPERSI
jgi:hypothetical protein